MSDNKEFDLSAWYAHPTTVEQAQLKLDAVRQRRKQQDGSLSALQIEEIIARYWLGREIKGDVENYQASYQSDINRALVTLIYGQLLMSRKQTGAMEYLQAGFRLATRYFQGSAYLEVMRRHDQLKCIVLTTQAVPALSLKELLQEAAIIKKLKGKISPHCDIRADRSDTLG